MRSGLLAALAASAASVASAGSCRDFVEDVGGLCRFADAASFSTICHGARDQLENELNAIGQATLSQKVSVQGKDYEDKMYSLFDLCALSLATAEACPWSCGMGHADVAHGPTGAMVKSKDLLCSFPQFSHCCTAFATKDCLADTAANPALQSFPTLQLTFPPTVRATRPENCNNETWSGVCPGELNTALDISVVRADFPGGNANNATDKSGGLTGLKAWQQHTYGYNGDGPGVNAPILRLYPGDDLNIQVTNSICSLGLGVGEDGACQLPFQSNTDWQPDGQLGAPHFGEDVIQWINKFRLFDATNLHTHGLHVGSEAPGDDVYTLYPPGQTYNRTDSVPTWHMPGSFWYHPHFHGATAIQAGSCAASMLIVDDPPGYLPPEIEGLEDIPLIMCPLQPNALHKYATQPGNPPKRTAHGHPSTGNRSAVLLTQDPGWQDSCMRECCAKGLAESLCGTERGQLCHDSVWGSYNVTAQERPALFTLTNGRSNPLHNIAANTWYRLRALWAAEKNAIQMVLPDGCDTYLLAKDGIYLPLAPREATRAFLGPGNRADLVVRCRPGVHVFESTSDPNNATEPLDKMVEYCRLIHTNSFASCDNEHSNALLAQGATLRSNRAFPESYRAVYDRLVELSGVKGTTQLSAIENGNSLGDPLLQDADGDDAMKKHHEAVCEANTCYVEGTYDESAPVEVNFPWAPVNSKLFTIVALEASTAPGHTGRRLQTTESDAVAMTSAVDTDGDGALNMAEFTALMMRASAEARSTAEIQRLFDGANTDGDGVVSSAEVRSMMVGAGTHRDALPGNCPCKPGVGCEICSVIALRFDCISSCWAWSPPPSPPPSPPSPPPPSPPPSPPPLPPPGKGELRLFKVNRPCYLVDVTDVIPTNGNGAATKIDFEIITNGNPDPSGRQNQFNINSKQWGGPDFNLWAHGATYAQKPQMEVGQVHELDLGGVAPKHVFHAHINPVQLVHAADCEAGNSPCGPRDWVSHYFQKGDWHDTLQLPMNGIGSIVANQSVKTQVRQLVKTQTDWFNGTQVVHCHILHHEDQGMMTNYNITGPAEQQSALWPGASAIPAGGVNGRCFRGSSNSSVAGIGFESPEIIEDYSLPSDCDPGSSFYRQLVDMGVCEQLE